MSMILNWLSNVPGETWMILAALVVLIIALHLVLAWSYEHRHAKTHRTLKVARRALSALPGVHLRTVVARRKNKPPTAREWGELRSWLAHRGMSQKEINEVIGTNIRTNRMIMTEQIKKWLKDRPKKRQ